MISKQKIMKTQSNCRESITHFGLWSGSAMLETRNIFQMHSWTLGKDKQKGASMPHCCTVAQGQNVWITVVLLLSSPLILSSPAVIGDQFLLIVCKAWIVMSWSVVAVKAALQDHPTGSSYLFSKMVTAKSLCDLGSVWFGFYLLESHEILLGLGTANLSPKVLQYLR